MALTHFQGHWRVLKIWDIVLRFVNMSQLVACYTCFWRPGLDEWISGFVLSSWCLKGFIRSSCGISLAEAATSIIFVMTNMYMCLSWQNTSFVMTKVCLPRQNVCRDKIMFVVTEVLSRQKTCVCFDKRAPDSWLKGPGFKSLQERRENFLLQGRLSVLTLISVSVPPPCYRSST